MQKLGATGRGSFSVSVKQTLAKVAFVEKKSLTTFPFVYINKVSSSLDDCVILLIFPWETGIRKTLFQRKEKGREYWIQDIDKAAHII